MSIPEERYVDITRPGSSTGGVPAEIRELQRRLDAHIGKGGNAHAIATPEEAGFMSQSDKEKFDTVQRGATQNQTDDYLLSLANATGELPIDQVEGLQEEIDRISGDSAAQLREDLGNDVEGNLGAHLVAFPAPEGESWNVADLANPDKGAAMVGRGVVAVDGLKGLAAIPPGLRRADLRYENDGFYVGSTVGGGAWKWKPDEPKANHNGSTIADPDRIAAWDGTLDDLATFYETGSGAGCFVRIDVKQSLSVESFGISPGVSPTAAFVAAFGASDRLDMFLDFPAKGEYAADADSIIPVTNVKIRSPHKKKTTLRNLRFVVENGLYSLGVGHSGTTESITYALSDNENTDRVIWIVDAKVSGIDRYFIRDMRGSADSFHYALCKIEGNEFLDNNLVANPELSNTNGFLLRLTTPCRLLQINSNRVERLGNSAASTGTRGFSYTPNVLPSMGTFVARDNYFHSIFGGGGSNAEVQAMMAFARVAYFENNELHEIHSNTESDMQDKEGIYTKATYTYFIRNRCFNASGRNGVLDAAALVAKGGSDALYSYAEGNVVYGGTRGVYLFGVYTESKDNTCIGGFEGVAHSPRNPSATLLAENPWLQEELAAGRAPAVRLDRNNVTTKLDGRVGAYLSLGVPDDPILKLKVEIVGGSYIVPAENPSAAQRALGFFVAGVSEKLDITVERVEMESKGASFFAGSIQNIPTGTLIFDKCTGRFGGAFSVVHGEYTRLDFDSLVITDNATLDGSTVLARFNAGPLNSAASRLDFCVREGSFPGEGSRVIRTNTQGSVRLSGQLKTRGPAVLNLAEFEGSTMARVEYDSLVVDGVSRGITLSGAATIETVKLNNSEIYSRSAGGAIAGLTLFNHSNPALAIGTFAMSSNIFGGSSYTSGFSGTMGAKVIGANSNNFGLDV